MNPNNKAQTPKGPKSPDTRDKPTQVKLQQNPNINNPEPAVAAPAQRRPEPQCPGSQHRHTTPTTSTMQTADQNVGRPLPASLANRNQLKIFF